MLADEYTILYSSEDKHWWYLTLRRHLFAEIRRYQKHNSQPLRLFDAGSGTGGLVSSLSHAFGKTFCLINCCEPNAYARQLSEGRNVHPLGCSITSIPEEHLSKYDIVTCIDVLYHKDISLEPALNKL